MPGLPPGPPGALSGDGHWPGPRRSFAAEPADSARDTTRPLRWRSDYEHEAHQVWPSSPRPPASGPRRAGGRRARRTLLRVLRRWRWGPSAASGGATACALSARRWGGRSWTAPAALLSPAAAVRHGYRAP